MQGAAANRFSGLLDLYPGSAAAYSLERLSKDTSNVVRVRRSSDDTEQDFTAAQVSDGTLVNFANNGTSDLYNKRMYFDGVDDYVKLTSALNITGDFYVDWTEVSPEIGQHSILGQESLSNDYIRWNIAGTGLEFRQNGGTIYTVSVTRELGKKTDYRFERDGTNIKAFKNGVLQDTVTGITVSSFDGDAIGIRNTAVGDWFKGTIFDLSIVDNGVATHSYQGYGNTNADWEDQIGSNDGTVSGSPALFTGQGFDGFVRTWYDQSGNARHAEQATAASQPQIVASGALVTENSKPSINFGSGKKLTFTALPSASGSSIYFVLNSDRSIDFSVLGGTDVFVPLSDAGVAIAEITRTAGDDSLVTIWKNGVNVTSSVTTRDDVYTNFLQNDDLVLMSFNNINPSGVNQIGEGGASSWAIEGHLSEVLIFDNAINSEILSNQLSRYSITP